MLVLVSTDVTYPVDLTYTKSHLHIDTADEDTYLQSLIHEATDTVERDLERDLVSKTWDLVLPCFPRLRHRLYLPRPPLKTLVSVSYYDEDETLQTWATEDYYVVKPHDQKGFIEAKEFYPVTYDRPDAVSIRFTSGYTAVQHTDKRLILLLVGALYENREAEITGTITSELKIGYERLLNLRKSTNYA